jgi:hypothetical protein
MGPDRSRLYSNTMKGCQAFCPCVGVV